MRDRDLPPCAVVAISPKRAEVDGDPFVMSADTHLHVLKEGRIKATLGLFHPENEAEGVIIYESRCPREHTSFELCRALKEAERHVPAY
jgi:hypothetical protein